jgi:Fic family protein
MGEVIKKIRNEEYYYFQDRVKIHNKTKVLSTQIGKTSLSEIELTDRRKQSFKSHYRRIWDIEFENNSEQAYHFEIISEKDNVSLIMIKSLYAIIRRYLSPQEFNAIDKERFVKHVSGTTRIEGNVIEYDDVKKILETEKTPSNYSINDVNEIYNYLLLISYLSDKKRSSVTAGMIKHIHSLLLNGITLTSISGKKIQVPLGKYRKESAFLRGIPFKVSPPELIEQEIEYLIKEHDGKINERLHPIECASIFHQRFEEIHPFVDGNGRTGREILNFMLQKYDYPPIYLPKRSEKHYYDALEKGNIKDYYALFKFILNRMLASVIYYWSKTSMSELVMKDDVFSIFFDDVNTNVLKNWVQTYNTDDLIP